SCRSSSTPPKPAWNPATSERGVGGAGDHVQRRRRHQAVKYREFEALEHGDLTVRERRRSTRVDHRGGREELVLREPWRDHFRAGQGHVERVLRLRQERITH